jgi:hypothetical protein
VVLRQPAVIAQDFTAPVTWDELPFQLASAVPADFEMEITIIMVRPGAMVVFRHEMVKAEDVSAPLAREREFAKNFPANVATVHYA